MEALSMKRASLGRILISFSYALSGMNYHVISALFSCIHVYLGLINDHKSLMHRIEELIPLALSSGPVPTACLPFARITRVAPGSLSAISGFCPGDLLICFGSLSKTQVPDASSLRLLTTELDAHRAKLMPVSVSRGSKTVSLSIDLTQISPSAQIQLGYSYNIYLLFLTG